MALLHLAREEWRCVAVTVDHRLREGSAQEAAFVAAECAKVGVPHHVLSRQVGAPAESRGGDDWRRPAAAREGRYARLAEIAEPLGAPVVTAHTLDDQAETARMRAVRGGGTLGLSGIPPVATLRDDIRLLRPLLGIERGALRRWLRDRDLPWIEDPTNDALAYERNRRRRHGSGVGRCAVARLATASRTYRSALMAAIAADLRANLFAEGETGCVYRPAARGPVLAEAVRVLAARIGRRSHLPSRSRIDAFLEREPAIAIAGTLIRRRGDAFTFERETRATTLGPCGENQAFRPEALDRFRPASDDPVHAVLRERLP